MKGFAFTDDLICSFSGATHPISPTGLRHILKRRSVTGEQGGNDAVSSLVEEGSKFPEVCRRSSPAVEKEHGLAAIAVVAEGSGIGVEILGHVHEHSPGWTRTTSSNAEGAASGGPLYINQLTTSPRRYL